MNVAAGSTAGRTVVVVVSIVQAGVLAALLGALLGDRVLRPVFAEALGGDPPETPASVSIRTRLGLAWGLGSGLPLVGIVVTPLVTRGADLGPVWPMCVLAAAGLLAGASITAATARSIAGPIARVRAALARVEEGDLDTSVVVDDPGELGALQAGVNEMVAGLRQRAELEDLFGRHVGEPVVRRALEHGVELGGELRSVSTLFVDITNSTLIARSRDPQQVVTMLNRFFDAVLASCDAEGGWVDDFQGDGAICVWGAPVDQPDHADRALRAARDLAARLAELRSEEPDLDAGIGVASGDVVAGNVGTERRLEYTVIGPPVNTAARLTVAAKSRPSRLLADAAALDAANPEERACWRPSAPVDLKGLEPGLAVFEPVLVTSAP
jgi:adenylate cyclase